MNSTLDYKGKTLLVNLILILLFDVNQISNITVQFSANFVMYGFWLKQFHVMDM